MSAETALIAAMRAHAPLLAAVRGIFLNAADEDTPLPYVVVTSTHDKEVLLTGDIDIAHVTFTIASWAAGAVQAEAVADLVATALEPVLEPAGDYAVLARTGGFDEQTANDVAVLTVDCWV